MQNQTWQTKPTKTNLTIQTYQTKHTEPKLLVQTEVTNHSDFIHLRPSYLPYIDINIEQIFPSNFTAMWTVFVWCKRVFASWGEVGAVNAWVYNAFGNVTSLISQFVCVAQTMQWSFQTLKLTLTLVPPILTTMCATLTSVKCKSRFHFPHTQTPTQRHTCT